MRKEDCESCYNNDCSEISNTVCIFSVECVFVFRKLLTCTEKQDEKEGEIRFDLFPLMQPSQQQDEPELTIPPDQIVDTPEPNNQRVDTPNSECCDLTYAPATTPRSRQAFKPKREEPPLTRLRPRVMPQDNVTERTQLLLAAWYYPLLCKSSNC